MLSITDQIVDGAMNSTVPILLETLIFHRVRRQLWNNNDIAKAFRLALSDIFSDAVEASLNEDDECFTSNDNIS